MKHVSRFALSIVLVATSASFRPKGWQWTGVFAGAGATAYGLASIVFAKFPGSNIPYPGGEGVAWGLAAVVWGVGFAALTRVRAKETVS